MNFSEYQQQLSDIQKHYPNANNDCDRRLASLALGLSGEVGEVNEIIKRYFRGDNEVINPQTVSKELGDVIAYVSLLADVLGLSLEDIATQNIDKLNKRVAANTLLGKGSDR